MTSKEVIKKLKSRSSRRNVKGMARFGINTKKALGISMPVLRKMAKEIGIDHKLAKRLWTSGIHEARILACLIDDPALVTEEQMDRWVKGFDSWDVCDQCCMNLFDKTNFAYQKAEEWSEGSAEFVKRAGFTMMAALAVHDKRSEDIYFTPFLPIIKREATDERNFVKKSVNWALRQIGKRNQNLNISAIKTAKEIQKIDSKSAHWIASHALRELTSEKVQQKLR